MLPIVRRTFVLSEIVFYREPFFFLVAMMEKEIVKDRCKPGLHVGPRSKLLVGTERTRIGLLNQVFSLVRLLCEVVGNSIEMVEVSHGFTGKLFLLCVLGLFPSSHRMMHYIKKATVQFDPKLSLSLSENGEIRHFAATCT